MNSEKLKPCPFCGGEAELVKEHFFGGDHYAGRCRSCAATSTFEFTKEKAIAAWNRRANSEIPNNSELWSFVRFCRNANDLWAVHDRARDLLAICKGNLQVAPKLTYDELEKMVKPLEWQGDIANLRLGGCGEVVFRAERSGQSDIFAALIELEDNVFTLECGLAEEDVKPVLQEFLVDIVAAALGVERSGK